MAKALRIGDEVTLPSGRKVKITAAGDPGRPWGAVESTWLWHVCRDHGRDGHPLVAFYFDPVRRTPMQLDEADAKALATALNLVR